MAEIVSSAVVQETVSQVLSGLVQKYEDKEDSTNANRNLERLEMAHIRLEAALETSEKWKITDASLLRWRRELKRAAQECDETLHKCKQRILEDEQMQHEVRNSSLPARIVHATKSFVSSMLHRNSNELRRSIAQRF
jgi:predicted RNase H-like nuclease (RuvC/YqgF family)